MPEALTPALLASMALLQARMHLLGEAYARTHNIRSGRAALQASEVADELLKHPSLSTEVRSLLERIGAFSISLHDDLPKGLSHFDYDIENILTDDDRVTAILDFGDIQCLPLVVCLGYSLWDALFEKGGSEAAVVRYVAKYQEVRPLSGRERGVLPEIVLFRHYVITTVQIHFGDFRQDDLDRALQQEQQLRNAAWRQWI